MTDRILGHKVSIKSKRIILPIIMAQKCLQNSWRFTLQRVSTLLDAATRGRKYGACLGLGYQDYSQIRKLYGDDDAQTLISMLQNRLALMVPDAQTAKYISENLGQQEILEKDENLSFGIDSTRDGVTIARRARLRHARSRRFKKLVA